MTKKEIVKILLRKIDKNFENHRDAADEIGISHDMLYKILNRDQAPSKAALDYIGYKKTIIYEKV